MIHQPSAATASFEPSAPSSTPTARPPPLHHPVVEDDDDDQCAAFTWISEDITTRLPTKKHHRYRTPSGSTRASVGTSLVLFVLLRRAAHLVIQKTIATTLQPLAVCVWPGTYYPNLELTVR